MAGGIIKNMEKARENLQVAIRKLIKVNCLHYNMIMALNQQVACLEKMNILNVRNISYLEQQIKILRNNL